MSASLNDHTNKVKAALETVGSLGVYRGEGPDSPHDHVPYVVLFPYPATWYGTEEDPNADVDYRVQVKAVGTTPEQADEAADRARSKLLDPATAASLAPTGRVLSGPVRCEPLRQATRDDTGPTPLFNCDDLYVVPTTPLS